MRRHKTADCSKQQEPQSGWTKKQRRPSHPHTQWAAEVEVRPAGATEAEAEGPLEAPPVRGPRRPSIPPWALEAAARPLKAAEGPLEAPSEAIEEAASTRYLMKFMKSSEYTYFMFTLANSGFSTGRTTAPFPCS